MKTFNDMLENLKSLLSINSVEITPEDNKPFGKGVCDALEFTLKLAEKCGFSTVNYDNYIGEAVFGDGEELAILCHLDVVPVGKLSDWKFPPFEPTEFDGKLFARGAIDDKGPLMATLYAMKLLKDEGFIPRKKIKLIFGCDEESGWRCIEHYKQKSVLPKIGFSPDASFPVIYAEKGIYHADYYFDFDKTKLFEISGGVAPNVVCDYASAKATIDNTLLKKYSLKLDGETIESFGKTAHGSQPENGVNALKNLTLYLEAIGAIDSKIRELLFDDCLSLKQLHDETGNLTLSPDMIKIENGKLCITVDIRYPSTIDFQPVLERLQAFTQIRELSHQKPLFNDQNSELIQTLLKVFNKHTGQSAKPIAIGGGTYARALTLGAGFGPEDESEPSTAHQPNEFISIEKLKLLVSMYKDAIRELTK